MAWFGKMVSACNHLEQNYQLLLVSVLQCRELESAKIVGRERRVFDELIELVEELFAVYFSDETSRVELRAVGKTAKKLYEERNNFVHSGWYIAPDKKTELATFRSKGYDTVKVEISKLTKLHDRFNECAVKIWEFTNRHFPAV